MSSRESTSEIPLDSSIAVPDYTLVAEISAKLGKESKDARNIYGGLIGSDIHTVKVVSL